jgi:hypothetical protein
MALAVSYVVFVYGTFAGKVKAGGAPDDSDHAGY